MTSISLVRFLTVGDVAVACMDGFIGNRMLEPYLREAEQLLLEGAAAPDIDGALESLGLAMGPLRMLDLAGVDVAAKVVIEREKAGTAPADPAYRIVVRKLFELGRHGQKTGAGFYRYEGRKPLPDPSLDGIVHDLARSARVPRRDAIESDEIVERLDHCARVRGNAHGYWDVADTQRRRAAKSRRISDWRRQDA
jgi:3-hydroxyacyl-CoA dehydrogenase